ncbi:hypothetical protein BC628DRAFT_1391171 [Trametes gibbosa]|nr:hypothetical protein BC628DRAFT_1391171 [Trametes gibbosa]
MIHRMPAWKRPLGSCPRESPSGICKLGTSAGGEGISPLIPRVACVHACSLTYRPRPLLENRARMAPITIWSRLAHKPFGNHPPYRRRQSGGTRSTAVVDLTIERTRLGIGAHLLYWAGWGIRLRGKNSVGACGSASASPDQWCQGQVWDTACAAGERYFGF